MIPLSVPEIEGGSPERDGGGEGEEEEEGLVWADSSSWDAFSGESPLPEVQSILAPSSPVLGGRLPWDAYNNGGEWLNSVYDVGPSLVGSKHMVISIYD